MDYLLFILLVSYLVTSSSLATIIKKHSNGCSVSEFSCSDGACVSQDVVCDGKRDCADDSDEARCGTGANITDVSRSHHRWKRQTEHEKTNITNSSILSRKIRQTSCASKWLWQCRDGACITFDKKCDGIKDCLDGSDESHPVCRNITCQSNWFRCTYGACVDGTAPCNGIQECADNSDELLPQCRKEADEVRGRFKCLDGSMISVGDKCDGVKNCPDGSDETVRACGSLKCSSYLFQCAYGACVDQGSECNKISDCADGSDEADALCNPNGPVTTVTTSTTARPTQGPQTELCRLPNYPAQGTYVANFPEARPGQSYDFITLTWSCNPGYAIVGQSKMYCYSGSWQYAFPTCTKLCQLHENPTLTYRCPIPNTNGGYKECESAVPDGTVVEPVCRGPNYYYPTNLSNMRCINGTWDYTAHCIAGAPKNFLNIIIKDTLNLTVSGRDIFTIHISGPSLSNETLDLFNEKSLIELPQFPSIDIR